MIDNPRVRLALAEHGRQIAIALAVLGAVLLVLAIWTVYAPGTEAVTTETDQETIATNVDHSAVVQTDDGPWDAGDTLENHPAYLLNASPVLDVEVVTDAPPGSTITHDARLEVAVVREGDVVWEDRYQIGGRERIVAEDGTAVTEGTVDVEAVREDVQSLSRQFSNVGSIETTLVADGEYETDAHEGTITTEAPLEIAGNAYWVDGDASARDTPSTVETVDRQAPVDWSTVGLLVVLGGLAVGGAVAAATYRGEADIEWLRQELHRQRYDDWISNGSIPMGVGGEYVSLDSLKDVVDVAIDTNQRVVYDDRRNVFAVISGDVVYYYSKDGDWNRVAWPQATPGDDGGPSFLEAFGMGDDGDLPEVGPTEGEGPPADGPAPQDGPGAPDGDPLDFAGSEADVESADGDEDGRQ